MEILIAALGSDDAEYAVEEFADWYGKSRTHAAEILEDVVMNWENDHRRRVISQAGFPEPLTVDSLLADASEGMGEAHAYDEEFAREMY